MHALASAPPSRRAHVIVAAPGTGTSRRLAWAAW
jgi:hypothetical protein